MTVCSADIIRRREDEAIVEAVVVVVAPALMAAAAATATVSSWCCCWDRAMVERNFLDWKTMDSGFLSMPERKGGGEAR